MSSGSERVGRRGPFPVKLRLLEVLQVTRLTPHMVRVTLGGPELEGFSSPGADDHVKVFFAEPGAKRPNMPVVGPNGLAMPEGLAKPASRDYTPRRFDAKAGELDIDFVLHGEGPASQWAERTKPGRLPGHRRTRAARMTWRTTSTGTCSRETRARCRPSPAAWRSCRPGLARSRSSRWRMRRRSNASTAGRT